MRKSALLLVALMTSSAMAQSIRGGAPVMSVCEVLADYQRIADTPVIIVGRMENLVGLFDSTEFLSGDRCPHPVATRGHPWRSKIRIWTHYSGEPGLPKPPSNSPSLNPKLVSAKLADVRRSTKLGSHAETTFQKGTQMVPNKWAAVYGVLFPSPLLNENCDSDDCRGSDVPLLIIANPRDVHPLRSDGTLR